MKDKLTYRACPACAGTQATKIEAYSLPDWVIAICDACDFVFLRNPPTYKALEEDLAWEKTYAVKKQTSRGSTAFSPIGRWFKHNVLYFGRDRRSKYGRWFDDGKVLDIGCGASGHIPLPMTPFGIELSRELHAQADAHMKSRGGYCLHGAVMTLSRLLLLACTSVFLAACQTSTPQETSIAPPALKRSATAEPGPRPVTPDRARAIFSALCIDHIGSASGTRNAAAANGFVQHTRFGTYYHPQDNLSVKLIDGDCSMVFVSKAPAAALSNALTSLDTPRPIRFRPSSQFNGSQYYNVRVATR